LAATQPPLYLRRGKYSRAKSYAVGAASQQREALGRGSCRALVELYAKPYIDMQIYKRADIYIGDQLQTFVVFLVY